MLRNAMAVSQSYVLQRRQLMEQCDAGICDTLQGRDSGGYEGSAISKNGFNGVQETLMTYRNHR
jgi:hypothetical protein